MKKRFHITTLLTIFIISIFLTSCVTYEYRRGRPTVYDDLEINRVAVWSFNDNEFTDYMTERLIKSSRWSIIDRANIVKILQEQNFQYSGRVDENTAVQIGRIMGVDAILFGEYRSDKVVVKMVDVETAEYLVFETVELNSRYTKDFNSRIAATTIIPYTIKYEYENNVFGRRVPNGKIAILLWHTADKEIF